MVRDASATKRQGQASAGKWTLALLLAAGTLAACGDRRDDRVLFDGQAFRSSARPDARNSVDFTTTVTPVSASFEGAREAGRYEATRYCIELFGTSRIDWISGPDDDPESLSVVNDTLTMRGACLF